VAVPRRNVVSMKVSRRKPPSSAGPVDADDKLGRLAPMHIDYDEARSSEERDTYHQSRLLAQGEFFLDAHPVGRLNAALTRAKRKR
jgi:hypothetical protein